MEFTQIVVLTFDGYASFAYVFMYLPQHTAPSNRQFSKTLIPNDLHNKHMRKRRNQLQWCEEWLIVKVLFPLLIASRRVPGLYCKSVGLRSQVSGPLSQRELIHKSQVFLKQLLKCGKSLKLQRL